MNFISTSTVFTNLRRGIRLGLIPLAPLAGLISLAAASGLGHAQTPPYFPIRPAGGGYGGYGTVRISTDSGFYRVGDSIQYCYQVPGPGRVTIVDLSPDGRRTVINDFRDDGRGGCLYGQVTPPTGRECLAISFDDGRFRDVVPGNNNGFAGGSTDQTCFSTSY